MKIGILGGTFDPPHFGHLTMAEEARVQAGLDQVWFLPTYVPPHKERRVTQAEDRIEMVRLAIADNPFFKLSLDEYERKGRSYTYETLLDLKKQHPESSYYFIIGGDMVKDLPNWYRINDLKKLVTFIGVTRPGYSLSKLEEEAVTLVSMPESHLSSTMIRSRIENRQSFRYYIPESVRNYIEEKHLYGYASD